LSPDVIVALLATNIEKAVDRAGPAQHFAAWPNMLATIGAGVFFGLIEPIDLGILQGLGIAHWDVNQR